MFIFGEHFKCLAPLFYYDWAYGKMSKTEFMKISSTHNLTVIFTCGRLAVSPVNVRPADDLETSLPGTFGSCAIRARANAAGKKTRRRSSRPATRGSSLKRTDLTVLDTRNSRHAASWAPDFIYPVVLFYSVRIRFLLTARPNRKTSTS